MNKALAKMDSDWVMTLPDSKFHRRQGIYNGSHFTPEGELIDEATWNARAHEWLPTDEDREYVRRLMVPVTEPGKMANWIAAPSRGINRQDVEFEYVRG